MKYHKLQGSQTVYKDIFFVISLRHIINYKVLKLYKIGDTHMGSLRDIINYKVLKHAVEIADKKDGLRDIINYKVLKPSHD